jgi:hypothetical protein
VPVLYTYVGNDPLNDTDPTGDDGEQLDEIVVQATRPPPPPPLSVALNATTVVGIRLDHFSATCDVTPFLSNVSV